MSLFLDEVEITDSNPPFSLLEPSRQKGRNGGSIKTKPTKEIMNWIPAPARNASLCEAGGFAGITKYMKKLITLIFFSLFFFLSAIPVRAEIVAGASAPLTHQSFIDENYFQQIKEKRLKTVIESVLNRYNSPLAGESESFVKACIKYQINCYLLPSIAGLESTFGKFIWPNSYNPFGWARGYMMFGNWAEGIETVAKGLNKGYFSKGAKTVEDIGPIYSESPTWAVRVNYFIRQFEKEEEKLTLLSSQFPVQL